MPDTSVAIVREGVAQFSLSVPPSANDAEKLAAEELRHYLQKATGADLVQSPATAKIRFVVATGDLASKIKYDGFAIIASTAGIDIVAREPRGIQNGVFYILRENAGITWLMPGDENEVVPKMTSLFIPAGTIVRNPVFQQRSVPLHCGPGNTPDTSKWLMRNGLQVAPVPGKEYSANMQMFQPGFCRGGFVLADLLVGGQGKGFAERESALMAEHPEYFGLLDGKRVSVKKCVPCTSNPQAVELMIKTVLAEAQEMHGKNFERNVTQGIDVWCECDKCRKLDENDDPRSRYSTRMWLFQNELAKRLLTPENAGIRQSLWVNWGSKCVPEGVKPDVRVNAIIPPGRCYLHSLTDPDCGINRHFYKGLFEAWQKTGVVLSTFEWINCVGGPSTYILNEDAWCDDLRFYHSLGLYGFCMPSLAPEGKYPLPWKNEYKVYNYWRSNWMQHWITGYYCWHPDGDCAAQLERIGRLYYGDAWQTIRAYRNWLKNAIRDSHICAGYGTASMAFGCISDDHPAVLTHASELLDKAAGEVKGQELFAQRLALEKEYFAKNWLQAADTWQKNKRPDVAVRQTPSVLVIDGKLEEACWQQAPILNDFRNKGKPAKIAAQLRLLHDHDYLYIALTCSKNSQKTLDTYRQGNGWDAFRGSNVELFLVPRNGDGFYWQFAFTPTGGLYQARTYGAACGDITAQSGIVWATGENNDAWFIEAKMPKSALGNATRLGINAGHAALLDDGKIEYSSLGAGAYHDTPLFPQIILIK